LSTVSGTVSAISGWVTSISGALVTVSGVAFAASGVAYAALPKTGGTVGALVVSGSISISGTTIISGTTTVYGPITFPTAASGTITTSGTAIILQQTGDQFGASSLQIQNRNGANGAIFFNNSLALSDLGFVPSGITTPSLLRVENRAGSQFTQASGIEFQIYPTGGAATPALAISTSGAQWNTPAIRFGTSTVSSGIYNSPTVVSGTYTGGTFTNPLFIGSMEKVYIVGTAVPSVANITLNSGSVWLYNVNASNTFTINITTSGTINTMLATGQAITSTVIVQQGASPTSYYATQIQIDGTNITPYWQNATAPASGLTVNGLDVYNFTAIKTGTSTYYTLASLTRF